MIHGKKKKKKKKKKYELRLWCKYLVDHEIKRRSS